MSDKGLVESSPRGPRPCYCGTPRDEDNPGCVYHQARAVERGLFERGPLRNACWDGEDA